VSNTLVHREYTSAFPAKVIIENGRIVTENWCMPKRPGRLDPDTFTPQPKNPLLANFFVNIGYADALGSGVRNLYKYTMLYSGREPELIEGDVFKTIVPLDLSNEYMADNGDVADKMADNVSDNGGVADKNYSVLLGHLAGNGEITASEAAAIIGRSSRTARRILYRLVNEGVVTAAGANRNKKYRLTDKK
jgi:ATP-dependent DNA helicase RecG